jgi:hypothetical protein
LEAEEAQTVFRSIALFLVLLAPFASAGVDTYTHALSPMESECSDNVGRSDGSYSFEGEGYTATQWHSYTAEDHGCESTSGIASAAIAANGHELASARADSSGSSNDSWSYNDRSAAWHRHDGTAGGSYSDGASEYRSGSTSTTEAAVATGVAQARVVDDCFYRDGGWSYRSSYNSRYDTDNRTDESSGSSDFGGWDSASGCERSATISSGVTTLSAGRGQGCTSRYAYTSGDYSYERDESSSSWTYDQDNSTRGCHEAYFVSAGGERAELRTEDHCESSAYSFSQTSDANASYAYDRRAEDCTKSTGATGPLGLEITQREGRRHSESCETDRGSTSCSSRDDAWKGLVVAHDYVGTVFAPLP